MKSFIYTCLLCVSTITAQEAHDKEPLQKINCYYSPLELTPKGSVRDTKFHIKKIKSQWASHPILIRPGTPESIKTTTEITASLNWAGYAAITDFTNPTKKSVTYVTGTWKVPTLEPSFVDTFSSVWVGIDGYSNFTVEQIGTEHDFIGGKQKNYAWFDLFPTAGYIIGGFPLKQGDHIQGEVKYLGDHQFEMTLYNHTRRVFAKIPKKYTKLKNAERSSAEWIVEAPSSSLSILPLAHFGTIPFTGCYTKIRHSIGAIENGNWFTDQIFMVHTDFSLKAASTSLENGGFNFSVNWFNE